MLQQTRVEAVKEYYRRFLERFPDIPTLAAADRDEVYCLWQGLGYYRRADMLHKAAKIVTEQYGGVLPGDHRSLLSLPGIGRYTAGAIAFHRFWTALSCCRRKCLASHHASSRPKG